MFTRAREGFRGIGCLVFIDNVGVRMWIPSLSSVSIWRTGEITLNAFSAGYSIRREDMWSEEDDIAFLRCCKWNSSLLEPPLYRTLSNRFINGRRFLCVFFLINYFFSLGILGIFPCGRPTHRGRWWDGHYTGINVYFHSASRTSLSLIHLSTSFLSMLCGH